MKSETQGETILLKDINAYEIQSFQLNRYPMLFIDYVQVVEPGVRATGHKNFSYNEWFFSGCTEETLNVPESIQAETLEHLFLMTFLTIPGNELRKTATLQVQFTSNQEIKAGERLDMEATLTSYRRGVAKGKVDGFRNGGLVCSAEFTVCIPDDMQAFRPKISHA